MSLRHKADSTENHQISSKIVSKVAARENVDPTELSTPLYEVVDPDALNELFAPTGNGWVQAYGKVSFTYCGYDITVESDGTVTVAE